MSTLTIAPTVVLDSRSRSAPGQVDNRLAYAGFALAYLLGHGAAAVSSGSDPLVKLPGWLPMALLATGLVGGSIAATVAATRAQRGVTGPEALTGKLLGSAWGVGFTALFLAITGLTSAFDRPELQTVLWPTGSAFVVGLIYLAEGAARRNLLHYLLGSWLALVGTAALFLGTPGPFWVLAVAGGGAYVLATVLEGRRLAAHR
ncbi:ABC transporter permease [Micromonospora craniellae]|uniref:ABC transporter permease n=1 Tax=Micromonospora craniellae TaxID=2294034 RepID=A0A372FUL0_9ACTN|nr:ABC transporter permease [Micromonospora craniellae]QOC89785.1 ABC transporter permease [Micromonospora craniellae]RFS44492.1 ABC transporter permease [Micromonospora craniellae]